ncbi:uncharacterized protein B0I36DRAFT_320577 [Microdochium trichocladiopsis]|uniref:Uncharacterized protein n=1 Tax=Microdochium trichocladiopsis TaxID=1682393 RepID=A0A9P8Y8A9_9PEZI|nr:uncharacterized protein B0I36DRAFT_320577 [Microdochium trichocladiopsis]KAH7033019.1 hypothetical protein B0I36DRAFT_320577 [Microdochium trichocladiopsis]
MASGSTDCYRGSRRESTASTKSRSSSRRPRLLRAAATEPSITTVHSPSGLLTNPNTNRRATDLLNMVVVSKTSYPPSSPSSSQSLSLEAQLRADQQLSGGNLHQSPYSACYFSFPSFDTWEDEEDNDDEKSSSRT